MTGAYLIVHLSDNRHFEQTTSIFERLVGGDYLAMPCVLAFDKNTFASVIYKDILSSDGHFGVPNKRVYVSYCFHALSDSRVILAMVIIVSFFVFSFLTFPSLRSPSTVSNSFCLLLLFPILLPLFPDLS